MKNKSGINTRQKKKGEKNGINKSNWQAIGAFGRITAAVAAPSPLVIIPLLTRLSPTARFQQMKRDATRFK